MQLTNRVTHPLHNAIANILRRCMAERFVEVSMRKRERQADPASGFLAMELETNPA